ncbi:hypothetical protein HDU93_003996 [Gonapodya sp. JEL0774]|nr:hypothetical protein HDU93_003996 [Gonapodya sp. JEL0774]
MSNYLIAAGLTAAATLGYRAIVPAESAHFPGLHAFQTPRSQSVGSTATEILDTLENDLESPDLYPLNMLPGGGWLEGPMGRIRYHVFGPEHGKRLVYVNGLSAVCGTSKDMLMKLSDAGFRVLAYGRYDLAFHLTQLRLLILENRFSETGFVLVGNSMGGAISVEYCRQYPSDVKALGLMAPAGLMERPLLSKVLAVPFLGEILIHALSQQIRRLGFGATHSRSPSITDDTVFLEVVNNMQTIVSPGHRRAVLSTVRNLTLWGMDDAFKEVGKNDRKVVVIWGTADNVVPYSVSRKVCSAIPNARLVTIDGAGHLLASDHAKLVADALVSGVA